MLAATDMAGSAAGDCRCAATSDGKRFDIVGSIVLISLNQWEASQKQARTRLPSLLQLRERHDTIVSLAADGDANPWRKVRTELALVDVDLKESDARRLATASNQI